MYVKKLGALCDSVVNKYSLEICRIDNQEPVGLRGSTGLLLLQNRHFCHPWQSTGLLLLQNRHFCHPWQS